MAGIAGAYLEGMTQAVPELLSNKKGKSSYLYRSIYEPVLLNGYIEKFRISLARPHGHMRAPNAAGVRTYLVRTKCPTSRGLRSTAGLVSKT